MRRMIIPFVLLVGVLTLAASGLADPGDKGKGKAQGKNKFSFSLTTTDRRCDLTEPWATLTETRTYQVHANGDGTFRLRRVDKGRFTTVAGKSPGNCPANKSKHGQMVRANVTGRFGGYLEGTIMGGVFNRKATCPVAACFTGDFLKAFFGAGAVFSCDGATNSTDCKFNYNYTAPTSGGNGKLVVRHWQDRGKGSGTTLVEHFHGDIASS
ncbi:MAG: hypothetical protein E6G09_03735 [Actinobacteria bacterium]|nr:MAG: hypothetical protein E6G09_03735 [Actinomycetota bacterium]